MNYSKHQSEILKNINVQRYSRSILIFNFRRENREKIKERERKKYIKKERERKTKRDKREERSRIDLSQKSSTVCSLWGDLKIIFQELISVV